MNAKKLKTKSRENNRSLFLKNKIGIERLGLMTSQSWYDDPKGLLFSLSRYKFVSKILKIVRKIKPDFIHPSGEYILQAHFIFI